MKKATKNSPQASTEDKIDLTVSTSTEVVSKTSPENQSNTTAKEKSSPRKKSREKTSNRNIVMSFLFLVVLAASSLAAYDFYLLNTQTTVNTQLIKVQSSFETRINQLEQQLQQTKNQLSAETQARATAQMERAEINSALQGINEKLGRSTVAWRMAEVEYLLTVANHRLTLAQDRQTAITVFATADSRLKAIADPSLLNVRKKIASELTALRAVPNVDIPGIAVQIGSLAESVEQLPLLDKKRLAVVTEKQTREAPDNWQEIPAAVWNDVKSLVQVRRHQQPTEPLLPPKQAWFLYKNLQLKLEQARLAALQKDTDVFVQILEEASHWLNSYFEVDAVAVVNTQTTLKKLREIKLQPAVPDVSGSLRELRAVMNARSNSKTSVINRQATKIPTAETSK